MELKNLIIDSKAAWVEFPGMPGFSIEVVNLSRKELLKLRKRCTSQKFDRKSRQLVEALDEERFVKEFTDATIKNWKGLTLEYLESLVLVNTEGKDPKSEIPYSQESAEILVATSTEFDTWLNEVIFDLENFRPKRDGNSVEEVG
jgi:hypothetical protein